MRLLWKVRTQTIRSAGGPFSLRSAQTPLSVRLSRRTRTRATSRRARFRADMPGGHDISALQWDGTVLRVTCPGCQAQFWGTDDMHEQLWEQIAGLGREETARRAGCRCLEDDNSWAISLVNCEYYVDSTRRTIQSVGVPPSARSAGYLEQLCILAYLVHARDLPQAGKLVSVEKLDPGGFFFRGSHRLPVEKLANAFGPDPQLLHRVGRMLNTVPRAFGDASIELLVLPRIPLTLIVWAADQEFPARASILFDQSATAHLPLDALLAAAALTIDCVVSTVGRVT